MPISTLRSSNNSPTSFIKFLLPIIGIVATVYLAKLVFTNVNVLKAKAALTADVYSGTADVYVNDTLLGKTPFSSKEINSGENKIRIKNDTREYTAQIDFIPNDQKYIHDVSIFTDLGTSEVFSSTREFWFEKDRAGDVLKIVSDPANASVFIDNTEVGKTPFSSNQLSDGEYDLRVDSPSYETQTARINIKKGYTLNIHFKLFPTPVPANISLLEGATDFYNVTSDSQTITSDSQSWAKAVAYWNKTRGLNIEGTGLNKEQIFDYYIDYKGNLFDAGGNLVTTDTETAALKDAKKGAYLGRVSDGTGITPEAKTTVLKLGQQGVGGKSAVILQTGTGWLRVRDNASLGGTEIARVNVGQTYPVSDQQTGWVKIKVSETITGWVSADYVKVSQ